MAVEREFQVKKTTHANPCGRSKQGKNTGVAEGRERRKRYETGLETHVEPCVFLTESFSTWSI